MNIFIFQSVPDRYDLEVQIKAGERDTWYATRYRKVMSEGDLVFFWMAGDDERKGIYGWGEIASAPYILPAWKSFGVDVVYKEKFKGKISKRILHQSDVLKQMLLFRAPQATNFLLSKEEGVELVNIVKEKGFFAPEVQDA